MSAATMGVSFMPPGTAHMSAVRTSRSLVKAMVAPAVNMRMRQAPSMMLTGPPIFLKRARSLRSIEQPTKAPATIWTAVRVASGTHAPPAVQFKAATPTNAPTMQPAGTRRRLNAAPHATPIATVSTNLNARCSDTSMIHLLMLPGSIIN